MDSEIKKELDELKSMVIQSISYVNDQVKSIDVNFSYPLFAAAITIIAGIVGIVTDMISYWLPASFIMIYLWSILSLRTTWKGNFSQNDSIDTHSLTITQGQLRFAFIWLLKNSSSLVTALNLIFGVNIIIIVLILMGKISADAQFNAWIPLINSSIYLLTWPALDSLAHSVERGSFHFPQISSLLGPRSGIAIIGILLFFFFYIFLMFVFPFFSLQQLNYLFITDGNFAWQKIGIVFIVLLIQIIGFILLSSHFSAVTARKELSNTITILGSIKQQTEECILNDAGDASSLSSLKNQYLDAKRFDLIIDDSYKIVQFYLLNMNRIYLKRQ